MARFNIGEHAVVVGLVVDTEANGLVVEITSRPRVALLEILDGRGCEATEVYTARLPFRGGPQAAMTAILATYNLRKLRRPKPRQRQRQRRKVKQQEAA